MIVLSSHVRLVARGIVVCGTVSSAPATVAVGIEGAPPDVAETSSDQSDEAFPETGGFGVELSAALSVLLLGALVGGVG